MLECLDVERRCEEESVKSKETNVSGGGTKTEQSKEYVHIGQLHFSVGIFLLRTQDT